MTHLLRMTVLTILATACLSAGDFRIIANPSVPVSAISFEEFQHVFLEVKATLADGTHVEPVLQKGGRAHQAVLRECLGKTDLALVAYYRGLVFTGKGFMPKVLDSNSAVAAYVARTKGAIGYVSADTNTPGVKTLEVK